MLKNYFTIAINNLLKNKLYSAINIIGLAVGLAACIVIALYVRDQYSYDKQWKDSDRIYRVNITLNLPGKAPEKNAGTPLPAMPLLEEYFKNEIELRARAFPYNMMIDTGTDKFEDTLVQVDPAFIEMFQLEVISGSLVTTLFEPGNIALSDEVARTHFGNHNPIGKTITLSLDTIKYDFKITAVYKVPGNTILDAPLLSLLDYDSKPASLKNWYNFFTGSFFKLKEGIDIDSLKPLLPAFIDQKVDFSMVSTNPDIPVSEMLSIDFQNIETAHMDSPWDTERAGGNKTTTLAFVAISLLVLIIGCANFIILTTAKATQRAREVAVRKVVGAKRKQLIIQFVSESTFIAMLAMILAMGIVEFMLPVFEAITGKMFSLDYTDTSVLLMLAVLLLIMGISGGIYPAFILSGFNPGKILKANRYRESGGSISFRASLVVFQFTVSIILIIATGVIYTQMRYSINRDPGYNKDNLLVINRLGFGGVFMDKIKPLKQELLSLANVTQVGLSDTEPSEQKGNFYTFTHPGQPENRHVIARTGIDYDYFSTYQIPVIAGRNYSIERDLPEPEFDFMTLTPGKNETKKVIERNIIINESTARELGFANSEEALGEIINSTTMGNINYKIIGVVADNHIFSINALPRAEVYLLEPDYAGIITVRFNGSPIEILKQVESVWKKVMGDIELSTVFANQLVAQEFELERTEVKIIISFSLLAILIACMGLFGSASFTVERRTKEIGLRKVMGARVKNIVRLLLWQFSKPVLIANLIAWPVAILAMQSWLERFPYRFNPLFMIPICLGSGFIALIIAWFTVAGNTTRVARSKPIKALRYE
ncbi:MAG: ABC transporter permease [Deltaproteobacteria bacterium]|nr:ABC transporter permease [Deltaproteobacteria bacterium]